MKRALIALRGTGAVAPEKIYTIVEAKVCIYRLINELKKGVDTSVDGRGVC